MSAGGNGASYISAGGLKAAGDFKQAESIDESENRIIEFKRWYLTDLKNRIRTMTRKQVKVPGLKVISHSSEATY